MEGTCDTQKAPYYEVQINGFEDVPANNEEAFLIGGRPANQSRLPLTITEVPFNTTQAGSSMENVIRPA
jgi:hypothetical protein